MSDEKIGATLRDGFLINEVPGAVITHRLQIDPEWYRTLADAFEICSRRFCCQACRAAIVKRRLELNDHALSRFEKQIILDAVLGRGVS